MSTEGLEISLTTDEEVIDGNPFTDETILTFTKAVLPKMIFSLIRFVNGECDRETVDKAYAHIKGLGDDFIWTMLRSENCESKDLFMELSKIEIISDSELPAKAWELLSKPSPHKTAYLKWKKQQDS